MKLIAVLNEVIEKLIMIIFVLTGLSIALALNYVLWRGLVESDFANIKDLQVEVKAHAQRIKELENRNPQ